jgi:hypothetical protein
VPRDHADVEKNKENDMPTRVIESRVPNDHIPAGVLMAALALVLVATLVTVSPPAHAKASAPSCASRTSSAGWEAAARKAKTALTTALTDIGSAHYTKASHQLNVLRHNIQIAHTSATDLIGRPPTDPESDDPPGVTAVLKVGALEHKVVTSLVPLFSEESGHQLARPLSRGLKQDVACRDAMLSKVIALKPAKRDDYVDGLSDTLPTFGKELSAISAELGAGGLTTSGHTTLTKTRNVVSATQAAMQKVFGGGERSPRTPGARARASFGHG